MLRKTLLACGIASALLYVALDISGALRWDNYSLLSRTISELSAIGSPSRPIAVALGIGYTLLATAFGLGVWRSADRNRALRIAAGLLIAYGALGLLAPLVPMHPREAEETLTDTMHIVLTTVTVLLILSSIAFAAAARGRRFRLYSFATLLTVLVFGAWTGLEGPKIAANQPTPWIGMTERISIGAWLLWVAVLAVVLLREQRAESSLHLQAPAFGDT
jgi:hypothetical protein